MNWFDAPRRTPVGKPSAKSQCFAQDPDVSDQTPLLTVGSILTARAARGDKSSLIYMWNLVVPRGPSV